MSYQVDKPYSVDAQEVDGAYIYSENPMQVSDPQFGTPPIISGGIDFFKSLIEDPTGTASGIATAVSGELEELPRRQIRTALGGGETYNPETGEVERFDPLSIPATTALGTAASMSKLPRDGSTVLGMLASTDTKGINPQFFPGLKRKEGEAQGRLEAGEDPRKVFEETGFMRINVDARPDRAPGDAPLETKMVFDIPDNLSQIKFSEILPPNVKPLVTQGASGKDILDSFEALKDSRKYFVERGYKAGKYGRSVQFKLKDVMSEEHPLFDVFPNLKDEIDVRIIENPPKGAGGFWDEKSNTIAIGADYMGNDRYTSTLFVHEIMHLLQTRGEIPGGSAPFLGPKALSDKLYDSFALAESVKFMEGNNFNLAQFIEGYGASGRPKGEQKELANLIRAAQFNVKHADPAAPDNLSRMWPGNPESTDTSELVDLDSMPYSKEVKAEMLRLIAEKEVKNNAKLETLEALGIDPFRITDESGSLLYSPAAQSNYMRTRGEFMARLSEAYALATEGMSPDQRRKLFPMDLAAPRNQSTPSILPTAEAPGGKEGIMGSTDLGSFKDVRTGEGVMRRTTFVDPSVKASPRGEIPPSEMGLVDIGAPRVGEPGGLINVDKLPPEIKPKLEYPKQSGGISPFGPMLGSANKMPTSNQQVKSFGFYQDNPDIARGNNDYTRENIEYLEQTRPEGDDYLRGPQTALLGVDLPNINVKAEKPFTLPSSFVNDLPGARNETRMAGDPQFDRLLASVREEGFDPDQKGNRVVVGVNHLGQAYVLEGNTRAAVAAEMGVPNIRAEVRYFNGSEMVDGPFSPQNLSRIADQGPQNMEKGGPVRAGIGNFIPYMQ
jgi:hypothetical protein